MQVLAYAILPLPKEPKVTHSIPIGAVVEVEDIRLCGNTCRELGEWTTIRGHGRLIVVEHTPEGLYNLSMHAVTPPQGDLEAMKAYTFYCSNFMFLCKEANLKPTGQVLEVMSWEEYSEGLIR